MRIAFVTSLLLAVLVCGTGRADSGPHATSYTTALTKIGTLLDDPAARAIIDRHIPGFSTARGVSLGRRLTLKDAQKHSSGKITDAMLAAIDADFALLPLRQ